MSGVEFQGSTNFTVIQPNEHGVITQWNLNADERATISRDMVLFANQTVTRPDLCMYFGLKPTKELCGLQPDEWRNRQNVFLQAGAVTSQLTVHGYNANNPHLLKINGDDFEVTYFGTQHMDANHPTAHLLCNLLTGTVFAGHDYVFMYVRLKRYKTAMQKANEKKTTSKKVEPFLGGSFANALKKDNYNDD